MPTDYTLSDLVKLTGVSARTVRYYIAQGLLPSPTQQGPNARYSEVHLDRLRLIRKLQSAHLPLAEIRRQLGTLPDDQLAAMAEHLPDFAPATDSALDYIESLLKPRRPAPVPPPMSPPMSPPAASAPTLSIDTSTFAQRALEAAPTDVTDAPPDAPRLTRPNSEPDRAQWERISLDPDIELHVRRPLTRQHSKQVERLIAIARELLKED